MERIIFFRKNKNDTGVNKLYIRLYGITYYNNIPIDMYRYMDR